jgi:hypothetical protein
MERRVLSVETAKRDGMALRWALVRQLSSFQMGETEALSSSIDWDEVTEVRFFDESKEIRLFERNGELSAAVITDSEEDKKNEKNKENVTFRDVQKELGHKGQFGSAVTIREYFAYDEDGQLYLASSRLKGWEVENHAGK